MSTLETMAPLLARLADQLPEPEDVKAGWVGFGVFLLLAAAVVVLGFSLRKHLRRVDFEEQGDTAAPPHQREAPNAADADRPDADDPEDGREARNGDRPSSV